MRLLRFALPALSVSSRPAYRPNTRSTRRTCSRRLGVPPGGPQQPHCVVPLARPLGWATVATEQPIDRDAAKLREPLQRVGAGAPVAAFVPKHGVPAEADAGGEPLLGEAEAGADGGDAFGETILHAGLHHGRSALRGRRQIVHQLRISAPA
jgi:hypothetical protein